MRVDFVVVGGGIAGLSAGFWLSALGKVVVLEMESAVGYHSTGRSAAVMSENYGPRVWRRLVSASRGFFECPPAGFAEYPILRPRGALFFALEDEVEALRRQADEMRARGAAAVLMPPEQALRFCPIVRAELFALALYEPDCRDVDASALMAGYARGLRARGGDVVLNAEARGLRREGGLWRVECAAGVFAAPVLVNAAGGWAQRVAAMAGLRRDVRAFQRTAVVVRAQDGDAVMSWPMVFDVAESFYFKPEGGDVMVSPVDARECEPCDAFADEVEVAVAMDRFQRYTRYEVRAVKHAWGGLRTFAPDHEPVIGEDPEAEGFFWLAGQGGNGVMGCDGAARLLASMVAGEGLPGDLRALGVRGEDVWPGRGVVVSGG